MNIDLNSVDLVLNLSSNLSETDEILRNINIIFTTPKGSVPLDRDFGIDFSILDNNLEKSKALLTIEYIEKTSRYEPRAKVLEVQFENDAIKGILKPKVVINIV